MMSDVGNGGGYVTMGAVYEKSLYHPLNFVVNIKLL